MPSAVLKLRFMKDFCAAVVESGDVNGYCQCGKSRSAPILLPKNRACGIDLTRTSGPEANWQDKTGMKACGADTFRYFFAI